MTTVPWEHLLHKKNREDYRKKVTEKMVALVNSQLEPPPPIASTQTSTDSNKTVETVKKIDTVSSITNCSGPTKIKWNGKKFIKVAQSSINKSPIDIWKHMEEEAAQKDMEESTEEEVT